jgi:ribosomal protein S12 methylthiotransferase accessory factor
VWPEKSRAQLAGALEVIERDAYMITWLNQITPARFPLDDIARKNPSLLRLVHMCRRYKLEPHAIRLVTDAPTYAVGVILEDMSGVAPRFGFGLKAHYSLAQAIEGALLEALRARRAYRRYFAAGDTWDPATPVRKIGHRDRLYYWGVPENAEKLAFLLRGPVSALHEEVWDKDTNSEHMARIVTWCRDSGYACVSVSLGASAMNPTPWSIERIIMPELQPTYLTEEQAQASGERLSEVPKRMGHVPRKEPFLEAPHPFS